MKTNSSSSHSILSINESDSLDKQWKASQLSSAHLSRMVINKVLEGAKPRLTNNQLQKLRFLWEKNLQTHASVPIGKVSEVKQEIRSIVSSNGVPNQFLSRPALPNQSISNFERKSNLKSSFIQETFLLKPLVTPSHHLVNEKRSKESEEDYWLTCFDRLDRKYRFPVLPLPHLHPSIDPTLFFRSCSPFLSSDFKYSLPLSFRPLPDPSYSPPPSHPFYFDPVLGMRCLVYVDQDWDLQRVKEMKIKIATFQNQQQQRLTGKYQKRKKKPLVKDQHQHSPSTSNQELNRGGGGGGEGNDSRQQEMKGRWMIGRVRGVRKGTIRYPLLSPQTPSTPTPQSSSSVSPSSPSDYLNSAVITLSFPHSPLTFLSLRVSHIYQPIHVHNALSREDESSEEDWDWQRVVMKDLVFPFPSPFLFLLVPASSSSSSSTSSSSARSNLESLNQVFLRSYLKQQSSLPPPLISPSASSSFQGEKRPLVRPENEEHKEKKAQKTSNDEKFDQIITKKDIENSEGEGEEDVHVSSSSCSSSSVSSVSLMAHLQGLERLVREIEGENKPEGSRLMEGTDEGTGVGVGLGGRKSFGVGFGVALEGLEGLGEEGLGLEGLGLEGLDLEGLGLEGLGLEGLEGIEEGGEGFEYSELEQKNTGEGLEQQKGDSEEIAIDNSSQDSIIRELNALEKLKDQEVNGQEIDDASDRSGLLSLSSRVLFSLPSSSTPLFPSLHPRVSFPFIFSFPPPPPPPSCFFSSSASEPFLLPSSLFFNFSSLILPFVTPTPSLDSSLPSPPTRSRHPFPSAFSASKSTPPTTSTSTSISPASLLLSKFGFSFFGSIYDPILEEIEEHFESLSSPYFPKNNSGEMPIEEETSKRIAIYLHQESPFPVLSSSHLPTSSSSASSSCCSAESSSFSSSQSEVSPYFSLFRTLSLRERREQRRQEREAEEDKQRDLTQEEWEIEMLKWDQKESQRKEGGGEGGQGERNEKDGNDRRGEGEERDLEGESLPQGEPSTRQTTDPQLGEPSSSADPLNSLTLCSPSPTPSWYPPFSPSLLIIGTLQQFRKGKKWKILLKHAYIHPLPLPPLPCLSLSPPSSSLSLFHRLLFLDSNQARMNRETVLREREKKKKGTTNYLSLSATDPPLPIPPPLLPFPTHYYSNVSPTSSSSSYSTGCKDSRFQFDLLLPEIRLFLTPGNPRAEERERRERGGGGGGDGPSVRDMILFS